MLVNIYNFLLHLFSVYVFVCVHAHTHVCKGQRTHCESFLSFKHMGSGDTAQVNALAPEASSCPHKDIFNLNKKNMLHLHFFKKTIHNKLSA